MSSRNDLNIFNVTFPFYVALKLFGMFPMSYDGDCRFGIVKVKCFDRVLPAIAIGVMMSVILLNSYSPTAKSPLVLNGWQLSLTCSLILVMAAFLYQVYKKNEAIEFLHLLNEFDVKANVLDVKMNMKAARRQLIRIMAMTAIVIVTICLGTSITFKLKKDYGVGYTLPLNYGYVLTYHGLLVLQFSFAALAIKSRFILLNDNLRFIFQNLSTKGISDINLHARGFVDDELSKTITDLYGILCDGIDKINDSFTFQLIPFMLYFLTANLFTIYSMIRESFFRTELMYVAIGVNIWWVALHTAIISIALYSGYTTTRCALKTPIIVSSIVKCHKWKDFPCVITVFKAFLLEVQYRNMFFENEFFRIDWKLLFSMVSTITTFLVITCQFDAGMKEQQTAKISTID